MCVDFLELRNYLDMFVRKKIDYLHVDIMDGHYVPNFTLGINFCETIFKYSGIPLDIHLMIEDVDRYVPEFAKFDNAVICFHPEVSYHPIRSLELIKSLGRKAGIAIDPAVSLEQIRYLLPYVDMLCVMTVNPGYAGQKLISGTIDKIRELSGYIKTNKLKIEIEVDGNVSWKNIPLMLEAGAGILVAGTSSLFDGINPVDENIEKIRTQQLKPV